MTTLQRRLKAASPIRWIVVMLVLAACTPAEAQTPLSPKHTIDVWTAGTLGLGTARNGTAMGAQLALSRGLDRTVITLRAAGEALYAESNYGRDHYDFGLLVGRRYANPKVPGPGNVGGTAASISLGLARLAYVEAPTASSPRRTGVGPAIAFNADVMAHLRTIGLGLSMFGASGVSDRYLGVGLTLGLGKIH